jgi:predicted RNA binding protein with dsRBD fold (UPF0201 family)
MDCNVKVSSKINLTEDQDKVEKAVRNIFPKGSIKIDKNYILIQGGCSLLKNLKEILEQRRIRATARSVMESKMKKDKIEFILNKQTALMGIINFIEGNQSPLGDIIVQVTTNDTEELLDWLAPVELI